MKMITFKKRTLAVCITSVLVGFSHVAWGVDGAPQVIDGSQLQKPGFINEQIMPNTTYLNTSLYLDSNHQSDGVTLTSDGTFDVIDNAQISNTTVNGSVEMDVFKAPDNAGNFAPGNPTIHNTTINDQVRLFLEANSISTGQLFIGKDALLHVDSNNRYLTNVLTNAPAAPGNVYIENLTLAGEAVISDNWTDDGAAVGVDIPLPDKPGPILVTRIDNLVMQPGSHLTLYAYKSGAQFNRLELKQLSGAGNIDLSTSLADGLSDQIVVSGQATGEFGLQVTDSGREVVTPQNVTLVDVNSGDAKFNLLNNGGIVEAGVWQYKLYSKTENGHTQWFLAGGKPGELPAPDTSVSPAAVVAPAVIVPAAIAATTQPDENVDSQPQPVLSNSARAVINMATAPRHILDTEISTLRQRMGDLRRNDGDVGVWARYLNDDSRLSDNHYSAFRSNSDGMQIGADHKTSFDNGQLLLGAFTTYSKTNIQSEKQDNGNTRSYGGGLYATWLDNSGLYFDTVVKANHLNNDVRAQMNNGTITKGDYNQNALTAALETGYTIPVTDYFSVVPYGKASYSRIGKADYSLDNGLQADVHAANSVQAEVGTLLESQFTLADVSVRPYVKAAIAREFVKNNDLGINNIAFDSDYSGNVGKYGLGVTADVAKNASVYAEVDYQNGNKVETPVNASAGFRFSF